MMRCMLIFLFLFSTILLSSDSLKPMLGLLQQYEESTKDFYYSAEQLGKKAGLVEWACSTAIGVIVGVPIGIIGCSLLNKDAEITSHIAIGVGSWCAGSIVCLFLGPRITEGVITSSVKVRKFISEEDNITYEHHFKASVDLYRMIYLYAVYSNISPDCLDILRHTLQSPIQRDVLWRIASKIRYKSQNSNSNE